MTTVPARGPRGRWVRGQSANPGGRRATPSELQSALRAASPVAVERLIALLGSEDERIALRAAEAILERTLLASPRAPDGDEPNDPPVAVEAQLVKMALSGDRAAALAYLQAHAGHRYGPNPDRTGEHAVDTVDFIPRILPDDGGAR